MDKVCVIGICGQSVFLNTKRIPKTGESVLCDSLHVEPGGKGINSALTIARLGGDVSFFTCFGDDSYGHDCIEFINNENINFKYVIKENAKTDYGVILHDENGSNCVSVYLGASKELGKEDIKLIENEIKQSKYVLLQAELSDEILLEVSKICGDNNVKIVFDPSPVRELPIDFVSRVWLFTPNETEYIPIIDKYKPKRVIITLGDHGAKYIENGNETYYDAYKVECNNSTGAGDVFNGALVYCLANDYTIDEAIEFSLKASAYKVSRDYVIKGVPTLEELKGM